MSWSWDEGMRVGQIKMPQFSLFLSRFSLFFPPWTNAFLIVVGFKFNFQSFEEAYLDRFYQCFHRFYGGENFLGFWLCNSCWCRFWELSFFTGILISPATNKSRSWKKEKKKNTYWGTNGYLCYSNTSTKCLPILPKTTLN